MDNNTIATTLLTPDGTLLVSRHVHDYQTHQDENGKTYMVDGGGSGYIRRSMQGDEAVNCIK